MIAESILVTDKVVMPHFLDVFFNFDTSCILQILLE